jgi:hypothetical protein
MPHAQHEGVFAGNSLFQITFVSESGNQQLFFCDIQPAAN